MCETVSKVVTVPLTFIRDYTVPPGDQDQWNRNRASIFPITFVFAFFWLNGYMQPGGDDSDSADDVRVNPYFLMGLFSMIPGILVGAIIYMKTKVTEAPSFLVSLLALVSFVMAIVWIQFTSNVIMDLLQLFGFVTQLPEALLALTIIAWGNCLGDMVADVAMTKKGFGEMAITGCIAGPIFNVLIGVGLSTFLSILRSSDPWHTKVDFSMKDTLSDGTTVLNKVSILPLVLLIGQISVLGLILLNGILNNFKISFKMSLISCVVYFMVIIGLVVFSIAEDVQPPSD